MGSLAVIVSPEADRGVEAAERALLAAPARGTVTRTSTATTAVLAVANDPARPDSWLAVENGRRAVLSGWLGNDDELRAELRSVGRPVVGDDPASTVLAAFAAWGPDAPSRFRGAFVGAIDDGTTLQLFRDQLGQRTLFFRAEPDRFIAATEAKQVLAAAGLERRPDVEAAEQVFYHQLPERRTALQGVERFPKATVATIRRPDEPRFRIYWDPEPLLETARVSVDEAVEELAHLLERAVRRTLTGRDAVSLSGGIDSPAVAGFGAAHHVALGGRPLTAIAAVYPDHPSVDESRYIQLVAEDLGLDLHTFVQASKPLDDLAGWADALDGPWDSLPVPQAAEGYRLAEELGVRTVLTGDLIEFVSTLTNHLPGHLLLHGRIGPTLRWIREKRAYRHPWRGIARELARSTIPVPAARLYLRARRDALAAHDRASFPPWMDADRFGIGRRPDFLRPARDRWRRRQIGPTRPGAWTSIEADDLVAARCGVEVRRPLGDVDLWEFFISLPAEVKFPDLVPKSLIRRAARGRVHETILARRDKTYFDAFVLDNADYDALAHWLGSPQHRVPGIDYDVLRSRIEQREFRLAELLWAQTLATVHAFLSLWE